MEIQRDRKTDMERLIDKKTKGWEDREIEIQRDKQADRQNVCLNGQKTEQYTDRQID
jgi:hypothetical protein